MKIDLEEFPQLDVTTVLDRKPLELEQAEVRLRGIFAAGGVLENEAQRASVIGHEIAHATQEHAYHQLQGA